MPEFNGNKAYIAIDGVHVYGHFVSVKIEPSIDKVDVTNGSGRKGKKRNIGLEDWICEVALACKDDAWDILPLLAPGKHTITVGPEHNNGVPTPGTPRHQQDFIFDGAPWEQEVSKSLVLLENSGEQADDPVYNYFTDRW